MKGEHGLPKFLHKKTPKVLCKVPWGFVILYHSFSSFTFCAAAFWLVLRIFSAPF